MHAKTWRNVAGVGKIAGAGALVGADGVREVAAQNLVAVIPGRDATLGEEVVFLPRTTTLCRRCQR